MVDFRYGKGLTPNAEKAFYLIDKRILVSRKNYELYDDFLNDIQKNFIINDEILFKQIYWDEHYKQKDLIMRGLAKISLSYKNFQVRCIEFNTKNHELIQIWEEKQHGNNYF